MQAGLIAAKMRDHMDKDWRDEDGAGEGRKSDERRPRPQRRLPRVRRCSWDLGLDWTQGNEGGETVSDAAGREVHPREWATTSDRPHQDFPEWGAGRVQEPFRKRVVDQSLYSNFYLSL